VNFVGKKLKAIIKRNIPKFEKGPILTILKSKYKEKIRQNIEIPVKTLPATDKGKKDKKIKRKSEGGG